jgi:hypothetical protein
MERLSIKEMRFQLSLRGISTLGMSERIELEKALQDNPVSSSSSSSSSTTSARPAPLPSTSLKRPLPTSDSTLVSSSASTGTFGEKKSKKLKKAKKIVEVEPEPLMLFWAHYEDSDGEFLKKRKTKLDTSDFISGWFFTDSPSDDLPSWFLKSCGKGSGKPENFPSELFSSFSFLTKRDDLCLEKNGGGGDGFLKRKLIVKQVGKEQGGDYCSAELGSDALYSFYREGDVETAALITSKAKSHEDAKTMLLQRIGINYEVIRLDKAAAQKSSSTTSKQAKKPTSTTKTKTKKKKEETRYSEDNDDDEDDDDEDDEDDGEY